MQGRKKRRSSFGAFVGCTVSALGLYAQAGCAVETDPEVAAEQSRIEMLAADQSRACSNPGGRHIPSMCPPADAGGVLDSGVDASVDGGDLDGGDLDGGDLDGGDGGTNDGGVVDGGYDEDGSFVNDAG